MAEGQVPMDFVPKRRKELCDMCLTKNNYPSHKCECNYHPLCVFKNAVLSRNMLADLLNAPDQMQFLGKFEPPQFANEPEKTDIPSTPWWIYGLLVLLHLGNLYFPLSIPLTFECFFFIFRSKQLKTECFFFLFQRRKLSTLSRTMFVLEIAYWVGLSPISLPRFLAMFLIIIANESVHLIKSYFLFQAIALEKTKNISSIQ
jgi:hypothetical protein